MSELPRSKLRGIIQRKVYHGAAAPQTPHGHSSPQQAVGYSGKVNKYKRTKGGNDEENIQLHCQTSPLLYPSASYNLSYRKLLETKIADTLSIVASRTSRLFTQCWIWFGEWFGGI